VPSIYEYTDPFVTTYANVPAAGPDVCAICHGISLGGYARCYSCKICIEAVSSPVIQVAPISLYAIPGQLHHVLRYYKDGAASVRPQFRTQVAAILARFLITHGDCLRQVAGDWDFITATPSSKGRVGPHPFEEVIGISRFLQDQYKGVLAPGPDTLTFRKASDNGYSVTSSVEGSRILLVDDTYTTGARIQSAASALQLAGATVVAAVPVGRVIRPDYDEETAAWWARVRSEPYDFDRCCLE
jgi:predicted amidophosphoribosyltransferase